MEVARQRGHTFAYGDNGLLGFFVAKVVPFSSSRPFLVAWLVSSKELPGDISSSLFSSGLPGLDGVGDEGGFKSGYCILHSVCVNRLLQYMIIKN